MRINLGSTAPIIDIATGKRIDAPGLNGWHRPMVAEISACEAEDARQRTAERRDEQRKAGSPTLVNDPLAGMSQKRIFFDCIWLSKESSNTKVMLVCIWRFFDTHARSSSMSYAQIASDCTLHESTAKRIARDILGKWLLIGVQKGFKTASGKQNLYHGIVPPELVEELRKLRRKGKDVEPDAVILLAADATVKGVAPGDLLDGQGVAPGYPLEQGVAPRDARGRVVGGVTLDNSEKEEKGDDAPRDASLPFEEDCHPSPKRGGAKQPKKAPPPQALEAYRLYIEVAERHELPMPKATNPILWSLAAVLRNFDGLDDWRRVLAKIEAVPALRGLGDGFSMKASLWWLTKDGGENVNKVLSGECDDWGKSRPSGKVVF